MNGLDLPLRPDKPAKHNGDEIASPRSAVRQFAYGLWLVVLCFAVLSLSSPRNFQPISSGAPAISSSPAEFVAITRTAALYDLGRSPGAAYVWRSEKQKHHVPSHADGAVLTAIPRRIAERLFDPESTLAPAIVALRPSRAFDAQAPPVDC